MSSLTRHTQAKRRARLRKAGKDRKNKMSKKSTLSTEELFAGFGKPGEKVEIKK